MGLAYGSPSTFKLKPEYIGILGPGLASKTTLASKTNLASKSSSIIPLVEASFDIGILHEAEYTGALWNSRFEIPMVTNENLKQGLRDLQIFNEE